MLFPQGSLDLVIGVYKDNPLADWLNAQLASAIAQMIKQAVTVGAKTHDNTAIRILEIGAGTGASTDLVLAALKPYHNQVQYTFTDISSSFTRAAQERYQHEYPFCNTKRLDIEDTVQSQGFELASYDIVFASNVLHATKNMTATLQHVKSLLKPSGALLINEIMQKSLFATCTFGLTAGWWLFEDKSQRIPGTPLLSYSSWQRLLFPTRLAGYYEVKQQ